MSKHKRPDKPKQERTIYPRGTQSFRLNSPDGWVDTNGPVWWYSSDKTTGWLNPIDGGMAAGMSSVTRATSLIVNRIASAPWEVNGVTPRWLGDPCLKRRDERYPLGSILPAGLRQTRSVFWGQWIRSALLWGTGSLLATLNSDGTPIPGQMMLLHPSAVVPADDRGYRRIELRDGSRLETDWDGDVDVFGSRMRLIELRCPVTPLDPNTGVTPGVLTYHAQELGLITAIDAYSQNTFAGAGIPSGYLKVNTPNFTQAQADNLKEAWQAAHGNSRATAILNATTDYQPIAVSPVDAGLIDMKRLSLVDVANAFGVPGYLISAPEGSSMTYSNVEMQLQALYEFTLRPWATAIEEELSALLPGEQQLDIRVQGEEVVSRVGAGDFGAPADLPTG